MTPNPQDSAVALEVERAKFEAWALSERWICSINSFGEYTYETVRDGWDAWKARASQSDGTSGGWRPIASAPKDGTWFLAFYNGRVEFFRWQELKLYPQDPVGWRDSFINVYREGTGPTVWQPMPTPPAPNQGENHVG